MEKKKKKTKKTAAVNSNDKINKKILALMAAADIKEYFATLLFDDLKMNLLIEKFEKLNFDMPVSGNGISFVLYSIGLPTDVMYNKKYGFQTHFTDVSKIKNYRQEFKMIDYLDMYNQIPGKFKNLKLSTSEYHIYFADKKHNQAVMNEIKKYIDYITLESEKYNNQLAKEEKAATKK